MANLTSVASFLLASALPSALGSGYRPPDLCAPTNTYEIYRFDLGERSDYSADVSADATGDNTFTYTSQYLFSIKGLAQYEALLIGSTSNGHALLFNEGNGHLLDCEKIISLDFAEVPGKDCEYRIDFGSKLACQEAISHWSGVAYVEGDGSAVITVQHLQQIGTSATSQYLEATGSKAVIANLAQNNAIITPDGSTNEAGANLDATVIGNAQLNASTETLVTDNSSSSSSKINSSVTEDPPKKQTPKRSGRSGLL